MYSAITPPFTGLVTLTSRTVLSSSAFTISSQFALISNFFFESKIPPSPSSVLITFALISSSTLKASAKVCPSSRLTSEIGRIPSFLHPRFTMTSLSVTWCTFPVTISPPLGNLKDFSISSIRSFMFNSLFSSVTSLILAITSLIVHSGVEAPAAIPILLHFATSFNGKSSIFSTK